MKNIIKLIKKIDKKGFTLIEILGVIVIMGLIIIVAIPTMSRMIHNNNNQKYENYNTLVREAAELYSSKVKDKIGSSKYTGCAEVTLDTLINEGHVQKFDDSDVKCTTGSGNIKIRNTKGSIKVNFQLICTPVDNAGNPTGTAVYDKGENDTDTCTPYVMLEENNIKMKLDMDSTLVTQASSETKETYITSGNNYVWYSGKMWRIVSYNTTTETVKVVTNNPITSIYYNSTGATTYAGSDIETWLNNDFLNTLKDPATFITSYSWNATANNDINTNKTNSNSIKKNKVGLINTFEYGKIKSWYGNDGTWLLSDGAYVTGNNTVTAKTPATFNALRPAIVIPSDVLVHSGSGTSSDPYIIDNTPNATGKNGELINTRFSGEYVEVNGKKYRIVSVTDGITKIISTTSLGKNVYDNDHYNYSASDLRNTLEGNLSSTLTLVENGDFCLDTINGDNVTYRSTKCLTSPNNSISIGIPKIGDLFTTKISGVGSYWTLNPHDELDATGQAYGSTINVVNTDGTVVAATITTQHDSVPVFYLKSNVKITGGAGTQSNPYKVS